MIWLMRFLAFIGFNVVYAKGVYLSLPVDVLEVSKHGKKPIINRGYILNRVLGSLYDLHNIKSLKGEVYIRAGGVKLHAKDGKVLKMDNLSFHRKESLDDVVEFFTALKEFSLYDKKAMGFTLHLVRNGKDTNYRIIGIDHTLEKAGDVTTRVTPKMVDSLKPLSYADVFNAAASVLLDKNLGVDYADSLPTSINTLEELAITYTPGTMHVIGHTTLKGEYIKLITSETNSEWVGILKHSSQRLLIDLDLNDPTVNQVQFVESSDTPTAVAWVKKADRHLLYTYERK